MWPDRVLNPGPLALVSDAIPIALCGPAPIQVKYRKVKGASGNLI